MTRLGKWLMGLSFLVFVPTYVACGSQAEVRDDEGPGRSKKNKKGKSVRADDADAAYRKAIDAEADEDFEEAADYYKLAIRKDKTHLRANQRFVHFLIDRGRFSKALKVAQNFFDDVPGKPVSYHTLADAEAANGEHQRVIGTMTGLLAFADDDASAYEIRGRARIKIGENEDGIADIRKAIELEPENSDFLVSLGGALMRVANGKEARKALSRALKVDPQSARAHLLLGLLSRIEGKKADALSHHKAAVIADPDDARAFYELGISHNIVGEDEAAEEAFDRAIVLEPENGTYWYSYADLLRLLMRTEESAAAYRQSVRYDAQNKRAWERLGETLLATGQLKDAAKHLKRGLNKVDNPRLHFLLAQVYLKADRNERAVEALENYLDAAEENAPDRKAAEKLLKKLR